MRKMRLLAIVAVLLPMSLSAVGPKSPLAQVMDRMNADMKQIKKTLRAPSLDETERGNLVQLVSDFEAAVLQARALPPDAVKANPEALQKYQGLFDDIIKHADTMRQLLMSQAATEVSVDSLRNEVIAIGADERAGHEAFRPHSDEP